MVMCPRQEESQGGPMKALVVVCAVFAAGCHSLAPDAGHQAVIVRKPMLFGSGGVDPTPVSTGRRYVAFTTTGVDVNIQPGRVDVEFADLMTSDGVPIDFHAVISYQVNDSVKLVRDFGADTAPNGVPGFWTRNLDQPFRTATRDAVKKHGMNEMAINATAAEAVDAEVTTHLLAILKETGVPVRLLDLSLGRANPPDAILHQRVETAAQEQRINTEKQRKLAEDQRKMAEESRAAADQAYNQKMGLNTEQYVALRALEMQRDVCGKSGNCTFLFGGNATPLINLK
jgi:regulator of protease activity HflC (stomatin/prohibitin superfamily)